MNLYKVTLSYNLAAQSSIEVLAGSIADAEAKAKQIFISRDFVCDDEYAWPLNGSVDNCTINDVEEVEEDVEEVKEE